MTDKLRAFPIRLATPFALAIGLLAAGAPQTRAAGVYGYSQQTLTTSSSPGPRSAR